MLDELQRIAIEDEMECEKVAQMLREGRVNHVYRQHPNKWLLDNHTKFS